MVRVNQLIVNIFNKYFITMNLFLCHRNTYVVVVIVIEVKDTTAIIEEQLRTDDIINLHIKCSPTDKVNE